MRSAGSRQLRSRLVMECGFSLFPSIIIQKVENRRVKMDLYMKQCSKCKQQKAQDGFYKECSVRHGLNCGVKKMTLLLTKTDLNLVAIRTRSGVSFWRKHADDADLSPRIYAN